jgi:DNA replication and repair protein RecF
MDYITQVDEKDFRVLLADSLEKDRALQYTTTGIHKDDLVFKLNGYPVKKFGSQGQQKSFLAAIRLAQFEFLKEAKGFKPILLLDDIFDKLDEHRIDRLMELVSGDNFGQIFLTDSHEERVAKVFKKLKIKTKLFKVEKGHVK